MGEKGKVLAVDRLNHREAEQEFRRFLDDLDRETDVVMEATFNWPWVAEMVENLGHRPRLADPLKSKQKIRGTGGAKNDFKDARDLGMLFLAGKFFPESYLAPLEVRQMRDIFRVRLLFVRIRTKIKNCIHGQLLRQGILLDDEVSDLFSPKGRNILAGLELSDHDRQELDRKLAALDDVSRHIAQVEKQLRQSIRLDDRAKYLLSLPGVGEITAYTILAEIGEIGRFVNGRALASYGGVLPLPNESAEKDFGARTSRRSNKYLRWAMIEAVTGAVRYSPRMRALHTRVRERNKKKPGKARVAVARELLELVYLVLSRQVMYLESPPPRPGSQVHKSERSGKARPRRVAKKAG
jgi:transposase